MICVFPGRQTPRLYTVHYLHGLDYVAGWEPYDLHDLDDVFPSLDLFYTVPAQQTITTAIVSRRALDHDCPMCARLALSALLASRGAIVSEDNLDVWVECTDGDGVAADDADSV